MRKKLDRRSHFGAFVLISPGPVFDLRIQAGRPTTAPLLDGGFPLAERQFLYELLIESSHQGWYIAGARP